MHVAVSILGWQNASKALFFNLLNFLCPNQSYLYFSSVDTRHYFRQLQCTAGCFGHWTQRWHRKNLTRLRTKISASEKETVFKKTLPRKNEDIFFHYTSCSVRIFILQHLAVPYSSVSATSKPAPANLSTHSQNAHTQYMCTIHGHSQPTSFISSPIITFITKSLLLGSKKDVTGKLKIPFVCSIIPCQHSILILEEKTQPECKRQD